MRIVTAGHTKYPGGMNSLHEVKKLPPLPLRPVDGHKGTFGRVLVIGGQTAMLGAPTLAATAALRMGAGLVQIAVPANILPFCLSITPELIGLALGPQSFAALNKALIQADAVVLGPGLGQSAPAQKLVRHVLKTDKPLVVDADALNIISKNKTLNRKFQGVWTPHPGEMQRLSSRLGIKNEFSSEISNDPGARLQLAAIVAQKFNQVIVLKGPHTIVTDGEKYSINKTGDSSLAKAGTGDVLSGMIATLLAQKMNTFEAACLAVQLHGKAGSAAGKSLHPRSVLASDVINHIAKVFE